MMDKPKWTPGPWALDGLFVRSTNDDAYVCEIKLAHDDPEVVATAHLLTAAPDLYAALDAVKRYGELNNVSVDPSVSTYYGGKKPASKDVWQFPRHMLVEIDAALSRARGETR